MRRLLLVLVLALTLAGCESSQVDRAATVQVSGRILRADGSPAAGAAVGLEPRPSAGELLGSALLVPLTLFTACLADPPPEICRGRSVRRTTTAADGTYSFQLKGKDTQGFLGTAATLALTAEVAPAAGEVAGAAVTATFRVQTEQLQLHDLQLWQPKVTVGPGKVGWEARNGSTSYQVLFEDSSARPVWSFADAKKAEVTFDPRVLEDTAGTLAVSSSEKATAEGTTVDILRRSARVEFRSAAGAPPSRGRPCSVGRNVPSTSPCPLTDGDFATRLPPPPPTTTTAGTTPTTAPAPDVATVDLGQSRNVTLVVVRGCACQIEGSADGKVWTALGRSTGDTAVALPRPAPARYVRLTGSSTDLREVSVW